MNITEIRNKLDDGNITSKELFDESIKLAKESMDTYNPFVTILDNYEKEDGNSILSGIPYALKDNISTRGILTTASSNILSNYVPVYDATIYKKLKSSGAVLMGKTVLDELAMGGTGMTGHTGIVRNPWDKTRQIGGSSAGSAAAVALGIVPFAIGSDTGDSVRKPAAYGGIEKDMTSLPDDNKSYVDTLNNSVKGKKLFYIKETLENDGSDSELSKVIDNFKEVIKKCESIGIEVHAESISKELLLALYPTYMAISCAEATSNDSNLTGIHFGVRGEGNTPDEIIRDARTKGFSELIKRRFIIGSYILQRENQEKLFLNAYRVRRLIVDKMDELFKEYDGLIMPAAAGIAPKFEDKSDKLSNKYLILDNHMCIGNFGGYPSITIPSGFINNMPVGINITGKVMNDAEVLNIANKIEDTMEYKDQIAKEWKNV